MKTAATRLLFASALVLGSMNPAGNAAVIFQFNYTDVGVGFNDPANGATRRGALELAGQIIGQSALGNYNATLNFEASGTAPPLASATPAFEGNPAGGGFGDTNVVRNKVLSNGATDLNGAAVDGFVDFDFSTTFWEFELNVAPSGGEFDFFSTIYHEFIHTLGWFDTIDPIFGTDPFGDGIGTPGEWTCASPKLRSLLD